MARAAADPIAALEQVVRAAFEELRAEAGPLSMFALCRDYGAIKAAGATEGSLRKTADGLKCLPSVIRWWAEGYIHQDAGEDAFEEWSRGPGRKLDGFEAAVEAMARLGESGAFGSGRRRPALLVTSDSRPNRDVLAAAVRLNPMALRSSLRGFFGPAPKPPPPATLGNWKIYSSDSLATAREGRVVAGAGWFGGGGVFAFDLGKKGAELLHDRCRSESVRDTALSPDGGTLYGLGNAGVLRWNLTNRKEALPPFPLQGTDRWCMALSEDGSRLATLSTGALEVLDAATGRQLAFEKRESNAVAWAHGNTVLADGASGVRLLDGSTLQVRHAILPEVAVSSLAFSPDGKKLAVGTRGAVLVIDLKGLRVSSAGACRGDAAGLAFSPDGKLLAVADTHGWVRCWRPGSEATVLEAKGPHEAMGAVAFVHGGRVAAAGRNVKGGAPVYLWKLPGRW